MSTTHHPYAQRLDQLSQTMHTMELDGIALNPGPDLFYFTGLNFHLSERPVVLLYVPGRPPALILPKLELLKLESCPLEIRAFSYEENPAQWPHAFRDACNTIGVDRKRLGIDPLAMRLLEHTLLSQAANGALFQEAGNIISGVRSIKSETEIQAIRTAVLIAESALANVLPLIQTGMSEQELAGELLIQLFKEGSDPNLPFMPIVASGPNSANPHASPGSRRLSPGDALVIDWGASFQGYSSDITRTFSVQQPSAELIQVHDVVRRANREGRLAGKPGATCDRVDEAARTVIEHAGFGSYFTHRTGHGIGLQCHEHPYIRSDNRQRLDTGMTYTVEPGIYLPDQLGVRIEDDVLIGEIDTVSLSTLDRSLVVVG